MKLDEISLSSLQESAHQFRKDLVRLPVIALEASTKYMNVRPGIQGKETFYNPEFDADFAPYENAVRSETQGSFNPRTIETFFGACFFNFDPNTIISSILGHKAAQAGNGAASTVSAREVCASVVKNLGRKLNRHLFSAKRNDAGKTTDALFDGFDTITDAEIAAGNISVEKGNLVILDEKITAANAVDVIKKAIFDAASDELREEDCFVYTSRSIVDAYNESYLMTHNGIVYNETYNQPTLEGSDGRMTFAPVVGKKNSKYIHICPAANMIVGVDQMSDKERFEVNRYEPKVRTGELYMYLGTQFESIDPRRLLVIQLAD